MHSQAQCGSRSRTYKRTFLRTERDCSWQACRNSKQRMEGWALRGESVRLAEGQLSQGQEVWKVNCRETHLARTEEPPSPYFPVAAFTEEPGSWLIRTHPALQASRKNFYLSCVAKPQPQMNRSICLFPAPKQPHVTKGSLSIRQIASTIIQDHQPHVEPRGGWRVYIPLVSAHPYPSTPISNLLCSPTLLRPLMLPPPPHCPHESSSSSSSFMLPNV